MEKRVVDNFIVSRKYKLINKIISMYNKFNKVISINNPYGIFKSIYPKKYVFTKLSKIKSGIKKEVINGVDTYIINPCGKDCIVYLHGGAYVSEPMDEHFYFADKVGRNTHYKIYLPIYPKLPLYNCTTSNKIMFEWFKQINPEKVVLMGDSAGGGMVFSMYQNILKSTNCKVKNIVAISPWLDVDTNNRKLSSITTDNILNKKALRKAGLMWRDKLDRKDPYANPVYYSLPENIPLLIIYGTNEIFVPDIDAFLKRNKNADILALQYVGMHHDFVLYPCDEGKLATKEVIRFLNKK